MTPNDDHTIEFGENHKQPPYVCGHPPSVVILDNNVLSLTIWMHWAEDNDGGLCLDCWSKKHGHIKKKKKRKVKRLGR